jgi:hypothetical protein
MQIQTASEKELFGFFETCAGLQILPNFTIPICLSFIDAIRRTSTKAKQHKAGTTSIKQANRYIFQGSLLSAASEGYDEQPLAGYGQS